MALYGASSSSSPIRPRAKYEVFLSFRGEDTRKTFTAHLYAALRQAGIITFMDDRLRSGDEISPALVKAIEQSEISIIVFSKNYASSRWCLDELMKILECRETRGQQVLPLFYDVHPSEIRHQINCVGEAFLVLEERFKDDEIKVQRWKTALTQVANLSGKPLGNKDEPEFIHEIIVWLNSILVKKTYFEVAQYSVGIESHIQSLKPLLDIEENDSTCMVGIFGIGGIGKTTIAKAIYNSIASRFEVSCFLENIRETSLIHLQNKLLSKVIVKGDSSLIVDNVDQGVTLIKQRLSLKRVLLILDDVDHSIQLEKIARQSDWFGLGSRIIITTRDKHLLTRHQVLPYEVEGLDEYKSLQLFSRHAFNRDRPDPGFLELAKDAIRYAGGLPLALTVLGSTLKGRDLLYWKSKLGEYKRIPNKNIQEKLKISYDGLEKNAKNIFLDIACFFKGEDIKYVAKTLDSCGFHSYTSIEELKEKCLITESRGRLKMHDLLQEMGREIVRQESPEEPGERSRLWFHEDVCHVLREDTGTNKVEAILINLLLEDSIYNPKAFEKMKKLRLLINRSPYFYGGSNLHSNELRLLDCYRCYGESLPSNFCGKNLIVLKLRESKLKKLEGVQNFQNMRIMNFSGCEFIREIPDVSSLPNLEELSLDHCINLVEVDCSVGLLDKLVVLNLVSCRNLTILPRSFKLRSLERLVILNCSMLKTFPEIEFPMEVLEYIDLRETRIEELPSSIGYLIGVKQMLLDGCKYLTNLPHTIHKLQHLKKLSLDGCIGIRKLPTSIGYLGIKKLDLEGCMNLMNLPYSIYQLQHLEILNLINCNQLQEILRLPPNVVEVQASGCESLAIFLEEPSRSQLLNTWDPPEPEGVRTASSALQSLSHGNNVVTESDFLIERDCPRNLKVLDLSHSAIVSLPAWLNEFVGLEELYLFDCKKLVEIPRLPPNVVKVDAFGCESLAIFLEEPRRSQLLNTWDPPEPVGVRTATSALQSSSHGNNVVTESDFVIERDCPRNLKVLDLSRSAIVSLPTWLNRFVRLEKLYLNHCKKLEEFPELPPQIVEVFANGCTSLERFQYNPTWLNRFVRLEELYLSHCKKPEEIPELRPNIKNVCANGCTSLERFQYNNINDSPLLEWIDFSNCHRLRETMGDDLQIRLMSEGHLKNREFGCIFPGNKIPDCFSQRQELSNTDWCEIDINEPLDVDLENKIFAFSAVIGTEDVEDEVCFRIQVVLISKGQLICCHMSRWISYAAGSDHVYLHFYGSHHSRLKTDNLRIIFKLEQSSSRYVFLKTWGFHLLQHRYEEEAIDLMDRIQHSKRSRGDDDDGNLESNC